MRIAIVKLSALGDIVHAMIILQFIKTYNQAIEVDWVVEERYKELLDSNPDINKIHVINLKKAKINKSLYLFYKEINKVRQLGPYDLVIDMQGLIKSALIARLIPSRTTLGFNKFSIRESIASIFYNKTFDYGYDENVIERNIALIEFALGMNVRKEQIENKLPFMYSSQRHLSTSLLNTKKNILLVPGASHNSKCYPVSKLAQFTTLLDANFLIIWGDQKEKIMADKLKALSPRVTVCEKLSIDFLVSLISQVDLIIGPDTGPTHIGWALNIPSITLFGPTPGYRNSYETRINQIIESNSEVNPFKIDKNDYSIEEIDVQDILKTSKELLNQL